MTAIVVDGKKLVVANVGDSRAILCRESDVVKQLTVDHEPEKERELVERKGGFVSTKPGPSYSYLWLCIDIPSIHLVYHVAMLL